MLRYLGAMIHLLGEEIKQLDLKGREVFVSLEEVAT